MINLGGRTSGAAGGLAQSDEQLTQDELFATLTPEEWAEVNAEG